MLLGHSRIDTTARYAAVTPQSVGRIVSPLDVQAQATAGKNPAKRKKTFVPAD